MGAENMGTARGRATLRRHRITSPVLVADRVPERLRRPEDLLAALFCLGGILFVVLIGLYAHSTTQGVAEDVRAALGGLVRGILRLPTTVIESFFVIIAPVAVIISLVRQHRYRSVVNVVITGAIATIVGWLTVVFIPHLPSELVDSLLVRTPTGSVLSLDVVVIVLSAALTVAAGENAAVRYSWWGIWFLLFVSLIWGTATVPGMIVTVLLGRLIGCLARWSFGFDDRRALPADLVQGVLDMGVTPARIVRSDLPTRIEPLDAWLVSEDPSDSPALDSHVAPRLITSMTDGPMEFMAPPTWGDHSDRTYRLWTTNGHEHDLHVFDPGQLLFSTIGDVWNRLRLRGLRRWIAPNAQASAERAMLAAQTAIDAGVFAPSPLGISRAGDSILVAWASTPLLAPLSKMQESGLEVDDSVLEQAWTQLLAAHSRGVAHRNLDIGSLNVDEHNNLWILDWHEGEVAATELSKTIDCAQMLVHLALVVGSERALASTKDVFTVEELTSVAVVIQSAVLPTEIRRLLRGNDLLSELRTAVAAEAEVPEEEVAPIKLTRFSPRTLIAVAVGAIAIFILMGSLNISQIAQTVTQANPWWMVATFVLGTFTWIGAAIPLVAFAPKKISLWTATLVQVAASIIGVVAPSGIGPAALNLRYLSKQKITLPLAAATVTLVQVSQVLTSVGLLIIIVALTGTSVSIPAPSADVVWIVAAVGAALAGVIAIPKVRAYLVSKGSEVWDQVRPQLLWLAGNPRSLVEAVVGNILMNVGFIGAFATSLLAFDYQLDFLTVAITYLLANTLGTAIPSPGGIGTVEAALAAGLQVAGVPAGVAVPSVLLFRLLTFYGKIPLGWFALNYIQKKGIV